MAIKMEEVYKILKRAFEAALREVKKATELPKKPVFKNKVVLIDAGHALNTAGKRTPKFEDGSFMREYEFNKPTAYYLKELCDSFGYLGVIVHPFDEENPNANAALRERMQLVNDLYNGYKSLGYEVVLISIHADAATSDGSWHSATGTTSFYWRNKGKTSWSKEGKKLASSLHKEMLKLGMKDRAWSFERDTAVGKNLGILRTHPVACLVECEFMTNKESAKRLLEDSFRRDCANAMFTGIKNYWND